MKRENLKKQQAKIEKENLKNQTAWLKNEIKQTMINNKWKIFFSICLNFVSIFFVIATSAIIKEIIDSVVSLEFKFSVWEILIAIFCLFGMFLSSWIVSRNRQILIANMCAESGNRVYSLVLQNDQTLKKCSPSQISSEVLRNTNTIMNLVIALIFGCYIVAISGVIYAIIVAWLNIYAGIMIVGVFVVMIPLQYKFFIVLSKKYIEMEIAGAASNEPVLESINGAKELIQLNKINFAEGKYVKFLNKYVKTHNSFASVNSFFNSIAAFFQIAIPILIITVIVFAKLGDNNSAGDIFFLYSMITSSISSLLMSIVAYEEKFNKDKLIARVTSLLKVENKPKPHEEFLGSGLDVDIKEFSYSENDELLLKNLKFTLNPSEFLMIKGESGSGKSTLFKLLSNREDLKNGNGKISLNGIDIQNLTRDEIFNYIKIVSSKPVIFQGSFKENLCLGDNFSYEEMNDVFKVCVLEDFFEEHGEDFEITADGGNISVGQAQRIAIARTLLRKPKFLLLDEPTSALDKETGEKFIERLKEFGKSHGMATLVITHSQSFVGDIVLKKGAEK